MDLMFVGLAILITEEKSHAMGSYTEGEVVFLDPSPAFATPEENENAGRHNQLLVVRKDDATFEGAMRPVPLQGALKPELFEPKTLEGLVGIPLRHSVAYAFGVDGKALTFADNRGNKAGQPDFRTIDFVPHLNALQPGLTLSKSWRQSPHVTTRFLLSAGEIGSDLPKQGNVASHKFFYGHQDARDARHYSDLIRFTPQTPPTAIIVDHPDHRTVVKLDRASEVWFMNLDDSRSDPTYDHFMLFGLLPWNFRRPEMVDSEFTGGDCLPARYHFKL